MTFEASRTHFPFALVVGALFVSTLGGCHRTFADVGQQRCVERSLERAPREMVLEAFPQFRSACADGDASACSALGVIEERGSIAPARPDVARRHYEVACAAGDTRGCANFGRVLLRGVGGPARPTEGRALLERSCDARDPVACGTLGWSLVGGRDLPRDEARGRDLLRAACDGGHAASCVELGDSLVADADVGDRRAAPALWLKGCALGASAGCGRMAPRLDKGTEAFERLRVAGP